MSSRTFPEPRIAAPKYNVGQRVVVSDPANGLQFVGTILAVQVDSDQYKPSITYTIGEWDSSRGKWFTSDGYTDELIMREAYDDEV